MVGGLNDLPPWFDPNARLTRDDLSDQVVDPRSSELVGR